MSIAHDRGGVIVSTTHCHRDVNSKHDVCLSRSSLECEYRRAIDLPLSPKIDLNDPRKHGIMIGIINFSSINHSFAAWVYSRDNRHIE